MATTPVDADAIFRLHYQSIGYNHIANLRCNLTEPYTIGEAPTMTAFTGSGDDIDSDALANLIKAAWAPMYKSTDHCISYEVWDQQTDPPTWIYAAGVTQVGTHSGADTQRVAHESTMTLKGSDGKKFKQIFFSTCQGDLGRIFDQTGTVYETWVNSMLTVASGSIGNYLCGRSAHHPLLLMSIALQVNNAWERKILYG